MLVKREPDTFEKLQRLGSMAVDDVLAPTPGVARARSPETYVTRQAPVPGVYRAAMPNGKFINLMRVMFTDFCVMDCAYCPNSIHVPRQRFAFKVEELARAFMEMHQRHTVEGLFLSSGIFGSGPSKTSERLIQVVEMLRHRYGFKGYIHLKVMPGTEYQYVEAAYRLGTRLSINIETPTAEHMRRLSTKKDLEGGILAPMSWIDKLTRQDGTGARGQVTQMVVGAADESDWDIFLRIQQLYGQWNLKRVYYSAFRPTRYTPLEEHPATPMAREHRLYQLDWLLRVYGYGAEELKPAFDDRGFLSLDFDPKTTIALTNLDSFPVDVNAATREQLLRVPGIGPTAAHRIILNRRRHRIDNWRDLEAMGVVRKRAWAFLALPGHKPTRARQGRLDLFQDGKGAPQKAQAAAPCGQAWSCAGCPLYGMPGHPGHHQPQLAMA